MSEEIKEYDERGNLIYSKNSYGYEEWQEFDENNNEIYYKDSFGYEYWTEYDENNNEIYYKNSDGTEYWYKYDKNDNEQIEITKKEFEQIKRNKGNKKSRELINNSNISRFELMDI